MGTDSHAATVPAGGPRPASQPSPGRMARTVAHPLDVEDLAAWCRDPSREAVAVIVSPTPAGEMLADCDALAARLGTEADVFVLASPYVADLLRDHGGLGVWGGALLILGHVKPSGGLYAHLIPPLRLLAWPPACRLGRVAEQVRHAARNGKRRGARARQGASPADTGAVPASALAAGMAV